MLSSHEIVVEKILVEEAFLARAPLAYRRDATVDHGYHRSGMCSTYSEGAYRFTYDKKRKTWGQLSILNGWRISCDGLLQSLLPKTTKASMFSALTAMGAKKVTKSATKPKMLEALADFLRDNYTTLAPGAITRIVPSIISSYTPTTPLATCLLLSPGAVTLIAPSLLL